MRPSLCWTVVCLRGRQTAARCNLKRQPQIMRKAMQRIAFGLIRPANNRARLDRIGNQRPGLQPLHPRNRHQVARTIALQHVNHLPADHALRA